MSGETTQITERNQVTGYGAESSSRAFSRSWSDALVKPVGVLYTALSLLNAGAKLEGGIIPDGADDAVYRERGARYAGPITAGGGGTVGVKVSWDDPSSPTGRYAKWASGTIYNERTVLCSLHGFNQPGARYEVRIGPNVRTNCTSIHAVERVVANPLVKDDSSRQFTFDLTVLTLSNPIEGTLPETLSTNRPARQSEVMLVGYGINGTLSSGYSARSDGFARAGTSVVDNVLTTGESSRFYVGTVFFETTANQMLAAPGDSGGGVYVVDETGQKKTQFGLIVSASGLGTTVLDLTEPDVQSFIRENAAPPNLSIQRYGDGVVVTWPYSPGFHLQTAPSPQGPWSDATNSISVANLQAKAVFNNDSATPLQLFRLRNEGH